MGLQGMGPRDKEAKVLYGQSPESYSTAAPTHNNGLAPEQKGAEEQLMTPTKSAHGGPSPGSHLSASPNGDTKRAASRYQSPLILSQLQSARALVSRLQRKGSEILAFSSQAKDPKTGAKRLMVDFLGHVTPVKPVVHPSPTDASKLLTDSETEPGLHKPASPPAQQAADSHAAASQCEGEHLVHSSPDGPKGLEITSAVPMSPATAGSILQAGDSAAEVLTVEQQLSVGLGLGKSFVADTPRKQQQYKMLQRERELSDAATDELQKQLHNVAVLQGRVTALEAERQGLLREIQLQRGQASGWEEELSEAQAQRDKLENELSMLRRTAAETQVEADRSAQLVYNLRSELVAADGRASEAEADALAARAELEAELSRRTHSQPSPSLQDSQLGSGAAATAATACVEAQDSSQQGPCADSNGSAAGDLGSQADAQGNSKGSALMLAESRCAALRSELSAVQGILGAWLEVADLCCDINLVDSSDGAGASKDGLGPRSTIAQAVHQVVQAVQLTRMLHVATPSSQQQQQKGSLPKIRMLQAEVEHLLDRALSNKGGHVLRTPVSSSGIKPTRWSEQGAPAGAAIPRGLPQAGTDAGFNKGKPVMEGLELRGLQAQECGHVPWDPAVGAACTLQGSQQRAWEAMDDSMAAELMGSSTLPPRAGAGPSVVAPVQRAGPGMEPSMAELQWMPNAVYTGGRASHDAAKPSYNGADALGYSTELEYRYYDQEGETSNTAVGMTVWDNGVYSTPQDPFKELAGMWELPAAEPPPCFD